MIHARLAAAALALVATAAAVPATASVGDVAAPSRQVRYHDLQLDTVAGRRALSHRVDVAVRQVCPAHDAPLDFAAGHCRDEARARAIADLGRAGIAL